MSSTQIESMKLSMLVFLFILGIVTGNPSIRRTDVPTIRDLDRQVDIPNIDPISNDDIVSGDDHPDIYYVHRIQPNLVLLELIRFISLDHQYMNILSIIKVKEVKG